MPENKCPKCGQTMQGETCAYCEAASAIAKPEHAKQAKVTPPLASDGAIREGEPPVTPAQPQIRNDSESPIESAFTTTLAIGFVLVPIALFLLCCIVCTRR